MVLSSVLAIGHFVTPSSSKNISADVNKTYIDLPFDCFELTTTFIKGDSSAGITLGNAEYELGSTNEYKDLQCYVISGLKSTDYAIQTGSYAGKTLGEVLEKNPYIKLPYTTQESNIVNGIIVGISYNAFQITDDNNLFSLVKGVYIPKQYRYIAKEAFRSSNVEEVIFQNNEIGSKYFGNGVFYQCKSLSRCYVENDNYILPNKLNNSSDLSKTSTIVPQNTFYQTNIQNAYIPNTFTEIGQSAFYGCSELTSVTFEATNTESVGGLTKIGMNVFQGCIKLSDIALPNTVTTIDKQAFHDTYSLKQFHIPSSVTSIGQKAFHLNTIYETDIITFDSPRSIIIDERTKGTDGKIVGITIDSTAFSISNNTLASSEITPYNYVYYNKTSEDDDIHKTLKGILATGKSSNADNVLNNASAIYIDHYPLNGTYKLSYIDGKDKENNIVLDTENLFGSSNNTTLSYAIGDKLLVNNDGISKGFKDVDGNENIIDLDQYDFKGYKLVLKSGDNVITTIDSTDTLTINDKTKIFTDIEIIAKYDIKKYTLTIVGDSIVSDAPLGETYADILKDKWYYNGDLNPDKLGYVGLYSDSKYTKLIDWNEEIGGNKTFYLRTVDFDDLYSFKEENGGYVITGLKSNIGPVSQLYFPSTHNNKNIVGIDTWAFNNNESLTRFYFADYDKDADFTFKFGNRSFQGCSNLVYAEIPVCSVVVGDGVFNNCHNDLEIIILGSTSMGTRNNKIEGIDNYANVVRSRYDNGSAEDAKDIYVEIKVNNSTHDTYSLFPHHYFYLPTEDEIYTLGYYLEKYELLYTDDSHEDGIQREVSNDDVITYSVLVNDADLNILEANTDFELIFKLITKCKFDISSNTVNCWSSDYKEFVSEQAPKLGVSVDSFYEVVDLPENATSIAEGAFKGDARIKKLIINLGLTSIGNEAFKNCENLSEIVFANGYSELLSLGDNSFNSCTSLRSFGKISDNNYVKISSLGASAFNNCIKLYEFYMSAESTLPKIGSEAFRNSVLYKFSLPDSVTELGSSCFAICDILTEFTFGNNSNLETIGEKAFYKSRIKNIDLSNTKVNSIGSKAFATTNINSFTLNNRSEDVITLNDIFYGSTIDQLNINRNIETDDKGATFRDAISSTPICFICRINIADKILFNGATYLNYNNDGIVYHETTDTIDISDGESCTKYEIVYIPTQYRGAITIPSRVVEIVDYSVFEGVEVNEVKLEGLFEFDRDYMIFDKDLYSIQNDKLTLQFVPNYDISDNIYILKSVIQKDDKTYNVVGMSNWALKSNSSIYVLKFEDNDKFDTNYLPNLSSMTIKTIVIPSFITTIKKGNFTGLTTLSTICILTECDNSGNLALNFSGIDDTEDAVSSVFYYQLKKLPVIIVPSADVSKYQSSNYFNKGFDIRSSLKITYDTNEGAELLDTEFEFGSTPNPETPTKTGYDFVGWYTDKDLKNPFDNIATYTDVTLYAKYNRHKYTYIYYVDGKNYFSEEVLYESYPQGPSEPTKKGKVFAGWKTEDGENYVLSKNKATADLELYAVFKTDNKYIAKIAIIGVAGIIVFGLFVALIVKSVRRKKNKNK